MAPHQCYRPDHPWTVYLIKSGDLFKIGIAESMRGRLRQLRNMSAIPVSHVAHMTVCCQDRARMYERELHGKYASSRKHGEWFRLNHVDIYAIRERFKSCWLNIRRRRRARLKFERQQLRAIAIRDRIKAER